MDDLEDELTSEMIEGLGITFMRPAFWKFRREHENTFLYWDEDAGSFRITPLRVDVDIDTYLAGVLEDERAHGAARKTFLHHEGVTWIADGESRSHFYVTGRGDLVLVCSYAFDPELYEEDDEFYGPAIDYGIEQFESVLASMKF